MLYIQPSLQRASELNQWNESTETLLPSLNQEVNAAFQQQALRWRGGFPKGSVIEWGIPYGMEGRSIPLQFLAHATREGHTLWVEREREKKRFQIYPPRFAAEGVLLNKLLFVATKNPIAELKPIFLEPLFNLIVLNDPQQCTQEDMMYLNQKARQHAFVIFVIRPFHLHPEKGNIWAKYRINIMEDQTLSFIKGGRYVSDHLQ